MAVSHKVTCIKTLNQQKAEAVARQSAAEIVFRKMAQNGEFDNGTIVAHAALFKLWDGVDEISGGEIRRCPENGNVYRYVAEAPPGGIAVAAFNEEAGAEASAKPARRGKPKPPSKDPSNWEMLV